MSPPLVVHLIDCLGTGGLENGLVNLINHMPWSAYRHAIVCLNGYTSFRQRITRDDVAVIDLRKSPGRQVTWYRDLWKAFRQLRPEIVHTRNLSALEGQVVARAAGVRGRVHSEHGRNMSDLYGTSRKYNLLRRLVGPCVGRYVAVNAELENWLITSVGAHPEKVTRIRNGVDTVRFSPREARRPPLGPPGFVDHQSFVVGTVGRMEPVKDQMTLARAFISLVERNPGATAHLRLVLIGDGPLRASCRELLEAHAVADRCWLAGDRGDIPEILRAFDVFVLPSIAEGMSNTLLEAMATGLPVIATDVGGNSEVVQGGITGSLVRQRDHQAIADALRIYLLQPKLASDHGAAGRRRAVSHFGLKAMVDAYQDLYDDVLGNGRRRLHWKATTPAAPVEHEA